MVRIKLKWKKFNFVQIRVGGYVDNDYIRLKYSSGYLWVLTQGADLMILKNCSSLFVAGNCCSGKRCVLWASYLLIFFYFSIHRCLFSVLSLFYNCYQAFQDRMEIFFYCNSQTAHLIQEVGKLCNDIVFPRPPLQP